MIILSTLAPFFVSLLTHFVKKLKAIELSKYKKTVIRFLAAVFSLLSALGIALATGTNVDPVTIETFVQAIITFGVALGIYHVGKSKRKPDAVPETVTPPSAETVTPPAE